MVKKGDVPIWVIVLAILGLLALIYMILVLSGIAEPNTESADVICTFSNLAHNMPWSGVTQAAPGAVSKPLRLCKTQYIEIQADDWDKCDANFKVEFNTGNKAEGLKSCAAQQVAELATRCWKMGGKGNWEPGSWTCFTAKIKVDEKDIGDVAQKLWEGYYAQLKSDFCTADMLPNLREGLGLDGCRTAINYIANLLAERYELLAWQEYYNEVGDNVNAKKQVEPIMTLTLAIERAIQSLLKDPASPYTIDYCVKGSGENEEKVLLDAGEDCPDTEDSARNKIWKKKSEATPACETEEGGRSIQVRKEADKACPAGSVEKKLDKYHATSEQIEAIGQELPDFTAITRQDLHKLMAETKMPLKTQTYSQILPSKNLKTPGGYALYKDTLFQVGFCDPPEPIGSGVRSRFNCNIATGQQIQIAPGGRSVSPLPKLCQLFNLGLPGLPQDVREVCKGIMGGLTGTGSQE